MTKIATNTLLTEHVPRPLLLCLSKLFLRHPRLDDLWQSEPTAAQPDLQPPSLQVFHTSAEVFKV
jgi:hypothetical protein